MPFRNQNQTLEEQLDQTKHELQRAKLHSDSLQNVVQELEDDLVEQIIKRHQTGNTLTAIEDRDILLDLLSDTERWNWIKKRMTISKPSAKNTKSAKNRVLGILQLHPNGLFLGEIADILLEENLLGFGVEATDILNELIMENRIYLHTLENKFRLK